MFNSKELAKLNWLILFLCQFYLLVDATNGFLLNSIGNSFGLSMLFKTVLLLLVLLSIGLDNPKHLSVILAVIVLLFIGPVISFVRFSDVGMLGFDIAMISKITAMGVFFTYFYQMIRQSPKYMSRKIHHIVLSNYFVILINFVLAVFGFGFAAYGEGNEEELEIGYKGFFYAANELSPVLFVLTAYLMQFFWLSNKKLYFLTFLASFVCSVLMLTKTGILSSVILFLAIPIFNERKRLFHITSRKIVLLSSLLISLFLVIINFEQILKSVGIYNKLMFFYNKNGLIGVLLSARDKFAIEIHSIFVTYFDNGVSWFFGVGGSGIGAFTSKFSAEIDSFDIYIWYGFVGVVVFMATIFFPLTRAVQLFKRDDYPFIPCVTVVSIVLFFVSQAAGHVVTSGMLGMLWGMIAARGIVNVDIPCSKLQTGSHAK